MMTIEEQRMQILEWIDNGKISVEDGLGLLQALTSVDDGQETVAGDVISSQEASAAKVQLADQESSDQVPGPIPEGMQVVSASSDKPSPALPLHAEKWRRWWMIPLWIGVGITVTGGLLMYQAMQAYGLGFWFVCAAMPLFLGLVVMVLAWQSRTAPWLHLRIDQKPGERPRRIAFSMPIPVKPTMWFLRMFGNKIPNLKDASVDELILALGETTSPENPLYIEVDEGEDGERVEFYIG